MIWQRKPKPDTATALDEASGRMMEAIVTGGDRGMAWIDFLVADAEHAASEGAAACSGGKEQRGE